MDKAVIPYRLDDQIGYVMRRATQRHLTIFADLVTGLTTTQFAALARLHELGPMSQNHLGRATAMDAATIKGVVGRLSAQGLVETQPDPGDRRRLTISLTGAGIAFVVASYDLARQVTVRTLEPLSEKEQVVLLGLLSRLT
jgi:MarR family transcriptional regulator, lower aerobic nicotinate degradation pathway regulator